VEFRKLKEEIEKVEGKPVYLGLKFMECSINQLASFFMPRIQSNSRVRAQLYATSARIFELLQSMPHYHFYPSTFQAFLSLLPFTYVCKMNNAMKNFDNFIM
ncbi:hypothetical protein MTO96_046905, partial [Rhipicephalus appendiculatus]